MSEAMLETAGAASERSLSTQRSSESSLMAGAGSQSESLSETSLDSLASHETIPNLVADSAAAEATALAAEGTSKSMLSSQKATGSGSSSSSVNSELDARWNKAPTKYTKDDLLFVMPSSVSR